MRETMRNIFAYHYHKQIQTKSSIHYQSKVIFCLSQYPTFWGKTHARSSVQLSEELSLCRIYKKSRSLRAFDRRPPPEATVVQLHDQDYGGAAMSIINHPSAAEKTDTSTSSPSNVVNPVFHHQSLENENEDNPDSQSCWDYDQFINSFHVWRITCLFMYGICTRRRRDLGGSTVLNFNLLKIIKR